MAEMHNRMEKMEQKQEHFHKSNVSKNTNKEGEYIDYEELK